MTTAGIITIGDELLIGQTIDTNSAFIAQQLNNMGIWVSKRIAVGDDYDQIWNSLSTLAEACDIIIITGGLGPTADDITKPLLCEYFNGKMVQNDEVLRHIEHLFINVYKRPQAAALERNKLQATVPDTCKVIFNEVGTAPGMWFEKLNSTGKNIVYISLPGVPFEMQHLMEQKVVPALFEQFKMHKIIHRNVLTFGLGESSVAELLVDFENKLPSYMKLAYLPSFGMVKLRLTAKETADTIIDDDEVNAQVEVLKALVKDYFISDTDEPMEILVSHLLKQQAKTLATAESCTGGNIAQLLTQHSGASQFFTGGVIAYANEVKQQVLQVSSDTLKSFGAVSEQTATAMAKGALATFKTDYALATTGIMGPGGGSEAKPVGTVWICAASKEKTVTKLLQLRFKRDRNIEIASVQALNLLRELIIDQ